MRIHPATLLLALVLTFPIWITVNYLGSPDNGVIVASYLGSLLMADKFLVLLLQLFYVLFGLRHVFVF